MEKIDRDKDRRPKKGWTKHATLNVNELSGTVSERICIDTHPLEQREIKIGQRFALEIMATTGTQSGSTTTCEENGKFFVTMTIGPKCKTK